MTPVSRPHHETLSNTPAIPPIPTANKDRSRRLLCAITGRGCTRSFSVCVFFGIHWSSRWVRLGDLLSQCCLERAHERTLWPSGWLGPRRRHFGCSIVPEPAGRPASVENNAAVWARPSLKERFARAGKSGYRPRRLRINRRRRDPQGRSQLVAPLVII